jgi:hypothetical protein
VPNEAALTGIICIASGPVGAGKVRAETWTSSASQHSRHGGAIRSVEDAQRLKTKRVSQTGSPCNCAAVRRCDLRGDVKTPLRSRAAIADVVTEERLLYGLLPCRSRDWGAGVCYPKREDTVFRPAPARTGGGICYRGVSLTPVARRLGTRLVGWRFISPS